MCFHGNTHSWAIKHPFISLYSKYQSLKFICLPVMNSPVFPSLDDIYCIIYIVVKHERIVGTFLRAASWLLGKWNKSYYPDFPAYRSPLQPIQSFDISRSKPSLVFACLEGFTNSTFKVAGLKEWPCCYIFKNNTIKFYIIR